MNHGGKRLKKSTITLTFTINEAEWLCSALYIASNQYAKKKSPLAAWTHGMATGLNARIEELTGSYVEDWSS
jgi:hypothetical protein